MRRNNYLKLSLIIIFSFLICIPKTFALSIDVNNWEELNTAITSKTYDEIHLGAGDNWAATSTITIDNQNITIISSSDITIERSSGFTGSFFDIKNNSKVIIGSTSNRIAFDGKLTEGCKSLININASNLNLNKVTIKNNIATTNGGAVLAVKAKLEFSNCIFDKNKGKYGGAIDTDANCTLNMYSSRVTNNEAFSASGGGIYANGTINISDSTISNNIASTYGGGMIIKVTATITNTTISNNVASTYSGGGLKVDGTLTMTGGSITNNKSMVSGAGINYTAGYFVNNNVTMADNTMLTDITVSNSFPDADSPNNVDWKKDNSLNIQEVKAATKLKNFKRSTSGELKSTGALQGLVLTDKYIVFAQWTTNDDNTYIQVLDKSTLKLKNTINTYNFGHANDLAYDPKSGYIYIHSGQTNSDGKIQVARFKLDANGKMTNLEYIEAPKHASGIAYDSENERFIYYFGGKIWIYDKNNKIINSFDSPTKLTTQGIGYYKGYVYFSCYEAGYPTTYQSFFNINEKGSNIIYMYNLSGKLMKTIYIPFTLIKGEIESIDFYDNGEMLIGYNKDGITFYKTDYPILLKSINVSTPPNKINYIINKGSLDSKGLALGLTYNNETKTNLNYDSKTMSIEGFNNTKLGKNKITVKYSQLTTSFDVEIVNTPTFKLSNLKKDDNKKIIKNIIINTKLKDLFDTTLNNEYVTIYSSDNSLIYSGSLNNNEMTMSTGQYVQFYNENGDKVKYGIAVKGDPSGDGKISSLDYVKVKNHIMEAKAIEGNEYLDAADYSEDNKISSLDYVKLKNYIMAKN